MTRVTIEIVIPDCRGCPLVTTARTPKAGYALDYFCTHGGGRKKIMGYVEYEGDIEPVPEWCPNRVEETSHATDRT